MRTGWMLALASALVGGCGHICVPKHLAVARDLVDLSATEDHAPVPESLVAEVAAEFQRRGAVAHPPGARPYHFLALSGGGFYGAFGVGVLTGWSETGTRPQFDVVSGVSTGALIATFAFLGQEYDDLLREQMVGVEPRDILRRLPIPAIPIIGALYSRNGLRRRVEEAITPQVLQAVACAHRAGRRLYLATTSLDARRLVVWDMGAIAARGTPEALHLYRGVVLASGAVPGAIPPILITVEIDGQRYEELHVDGGVSDNNIFRAFMVADLNRANGVPGAWAAPGSTLYAINNGKFYADPTCLRGVFSVVGATFETLLSNKTRDELNRMYLNCLQTGVAFRATAVPQDLDIPRNSLDLKAEDQRRLFDAGRRAGRAGVTGANWRTTPPGADVSEQAVPRSGTRFASPPR